MKTRNLLVSVLMLVSVLFSACTPAVTATQAPTLLSPTSAPSSTPAVSDFTLTGDLVPEKFLNVDYLTGRVALRLLTPDDVFCRALKTQGNCFSIRRTDDPSDPGARGPAALINGLIAVKFQACPNCTSDEIGSIEYFEPNEDDGVLTVVRCETKTGAACNADVGTTWKPAPEQITWHSPENSAFHLPMAFNYVPGWDTHIVINDVDIVYMGNPAGPQSEWWGPNIVLLNGAKVADPAKITDPAQMTTPSLDDFLPLPDDFFAYVASIPGMKVVQNPTSVTIGGVQGLQMIVHSPAVMHTMLWLKDDYTGHGDAYSDRKALLILLDVNGEQVLLEYYDSPDKFDERYPLVLEIFNSITFGK